MPFIHLRLFAQPINIPPPTPGPNSTKPGLKNPSSSSPRPASTPVPPSSTPWAARFWKLFPRFPGAVKQPPGSGPCGNSCPSPTSKAGISSNKVTKDTAPPPAVKGKTAAEKTVNLVKYIEEHLQSGRYDATARIDLDSGYFQCDCSGLVDWILSGSAPQALKEVEAKKNKGQSRLVVANFVATLKKITAGQDTAGWRRIARIADAQPGDVIAWPTPDWYPSDATGHMGIVMAPPEAVPGGYLIRIADSTSYPHGEDTRREGSGFGYGTILITVDDATGEGTGQGWTGKHSEATVIRTEIYLGRPLS